MSVRRTYDGWHHFCKQRERDSSFTVTASAYVRTAREKHGTATSLM